MEQKLTAVESPLHCGNGATILVVEDSPVQSEVMRRALESAGYQVILAHDGAEGFAMAQANHPAAVVSDIVMPVMDGYTMCHALRGDAQLKHTPVILLTVLSDPQDVVRGLNAGADCYVTKPYVEQLVLTRLAALLAEPPDRDETPLAMKASVDGVPFQVRAGANRVLNLLISTYENAVLNQRELTAAQDALAASNSRLEEQVRARTLNLEQSIEELAREIDERRRLEERLRQANGKLNLSVGNLEQRSAQLALLDNMVNRLQACRSIEETCAAVADAMPQLFSSCSGLLVLADEPCERFSVVSSWGGAGSGPCAWSQEICLALRDASLHNFDATDANRACGRACIAPGAECFCIPLVAQGKTLGLLHLQGALAGSVAGETDNGARRGAHIRVIQAAAKTITLAIANLRLREELRQLSLRDPLTGLYNRRFLQDALERETARARRSGAPLGVVMLDIDHFKRINDTLGHLAGDRVLTRIGQALRDSLRREDIACRYGGDEFILLLPGATREHAAARAEQIRAEVEAGTQIEFDGSSIGPLTVSLGVAALCLDTSGPASAVVAMKDADAALCRAKQLGRNRVVLAEFACGNGSGAAAVDVDAPGARPASNTAGDAEAGRV